MIALQSLNVRDVVIDENNAGYVICETDEQRGHANHCLEAPFANVAQVVEGVSARGQTFESLARHDQPIVNLPSSNNHTDASYDCQKDDNLLEVKDQRQIIEFLLDLCHLQTHHIRLLIAKVS